MTSSPGRALSLIRKIDVKTAFRISGSLALYGQGPHRPVRSSILLPDWHLSGTHLRFPLAYSL